MGVTKCVFEEYQRLKGLFLNGAEDKLKLVDELLKKTAFLKVELDFLEKQITKLGSIQTSNKGNVRVSVHYKTYLQTVGVYQNLIKSLNSILDSNVVDEEDEFDEFIKKAGEM